jgi:hypothetical protein
MARVAGGDDGDTREWLARRLGMGSGPNPSNRVCAKEQCNK